MLTVAKYDIVSVSPVSLTTKKTAEHDFPLETPGINAGIRALLTFTLFLRSKKASFLMSIVNSKGTTPLRIFSGGIELGAMGQVVIDVNILESKNNTLRIGVEDGSVDFSNIVLWYQTNV